MNTPPPCTGGQIGYGETNSTRRLLGVARDDGERVAEVAAQRPANASVSPIAAKLTRARARAKRLGEAAAKARPMPAKFGALRRIAEKPADHRAGPGEEEVTASSVAIRGCSSTRTAGNSSSARVWIWASLKRLADGAAMLVIDDAAGWYSTFQPRFQAM